jgi:hypothetical protein
MVLMVLCASIGRDSRKPHHHLSQVFKAERSRTKRDKADPGPNLVMMGAWALVGTVRVLNYCLCI